MASAVTFGTRAINIAWALLGLLPGTAGRNHLRLLTALEPVFRETFGLDHHIATRMILTGQVPLGREIYRLFRESNVNVDRILEIIFGEEVSHGSFFGGPINFDTIEGILRTQAYANRKPSVTSPEVVLDAALDRATERDRTIVDDFWLYKDQVYRHVINSRSGVLADFACQAFMRRHIGQLTEHDYFATETQIFGKLVGLRRLLRSKTFESEIASLFDRPIAYKARRFFVDAQGDFFRWEDTKRYQQTKNDCNLSPLNLNVEAAAEIEQDLFDDDSHRPSEGAFGNYA
jgi:uncharacterized protein